MKKMFIYSIVFSLFFVYCDKEETIVEYAPKQLKSAAGDTLIINYDETINLQDGKSWIKFIDVEDSRCPTNVVCVWEGNAKVKLVYFNGNTEKVFYLNTHGTQNMQKEIVIEDLYFELSDVSPYPDGSELSKEEYKLKIYIQYLDKLDGIKSEIAGTVKDYTGLDGCGWVIELEDGNKLEPAFVLPNFQFYDGQEVILWYKEVNDFSSICMAGQISKIYKIISVSCPSYTTLGFGGALEDYPSDFIAMDTAYIKDKILYISVGHSGGCAEHTYKLLTYPIMCGTPPLPKPVFWLSHDANGDVCEAYLRDTLCFNISSLYSMYPEDTEIEIRTISGDRSIILNN